MQQKRRQNVKEEAAEVEKEAVQVQQYLPHKCCKFSEKIGKKWRHKYRKNRQMQQIHQQKCNNIRQNRGDTYDGSRLPLAFCPRLLMILRRDLSNKMRSDTGIIADHPAPELKWSCQTGSYLVHKSKSAHCV